jgi:putative glutamine amidotransferase
MVGELKMFIGIPIFAPKLTYNINKTYVDYIETAGHTPILITSDKSNKAPHKLLSLCDAFLMPGGIDIDPTYYKEQNITSFYANIHKDNFERSILAYAGHEGKKIFGICRGFQLISREIIYHENIQNIKFIQHVEGHSNVNDLEIDRSNVSHEVCFNDHTEFVNSIHHQALVTQILNNGDIEGNNSTIKIEALSNNIHDDIPIIEAISGTYKNSKYYAVQWHPEELCNKNLLNFFNED